MRHILNLSDDGRVLSAGMYAVIPADAVQVDKLPEGDLYDYRYENGEFIYDPLPKPPVEPKKLVWDELDAAYREGVDSV